jgi:hypothetical protein
VTVTRCVVTCFACDEYGASTRAVTVTPHSFMDQAWFKYRMIMTDPPRACRHRGGDGVPDDGLLGWDAEADGATIEHQGCTREFMVFWSRDQTLLFI